MQFLPLHGNNFLVGPSCGRVPAIVVISTAVLGKSSGPDEGGGLKGFFSKKETRNNMGGDDGAPPVSDFLNCCVNLQPLSLSLSLAVLDVSPSLYSSSIKLFRRKRASFPSKENFSIGASYFPQMRPIRFLLSVSFLGAKGSIVPVFV